MLQALRPRVSDVELASVSDVLSEAEARLFFAMEKRDQRHALEVARRLRESNVEDADLLAAALLHDCGKGAVPVWLRILKVLSSRLLHTVASQGGGWQGAAYRLAHHTSLGADLAGAAGASATAVRLIAGRPAPDEEPRAQLLRMADDAS